MSYSQSPAYVSREMEYANGQEYNEYELATRMLSVQSEAELDQFLGSLVRSAWRGAKALYRSPVGQAVKKQAVSSLKSFGRRVLPTLGRSVGGYLGGKSGARLGAHAGSYLSNKYLKKEYEGLSPSDRDVETARRLVRTARLAAYNLSQYLAEGRAISRKTIKTAILRAARKFFPGMPKKLYSRPADLPYLSTSYYRPRSGGKTQVIPLKTRRKSAGQISRTVPRTKTQGRWQRQGNRIVLSIA